MCGADLALTPTQKVWGGSSPRVRGRLDIAVPSTMISGLIPACAGQTTAELLVDHVDLGSSPRVRGRLRPSARAHGRRGLIPACAGQTKPPNRSAFAGRAHPRVCGADLPWPRNSDVWTGSSPRVRGRRGFPGVHDGGGGLIPACAGQTVRCRSLVCSSRAHPRVCGADHGLLKRRKIAGGLIPACAGQTAYRRPRRCAAGAHPRVCGADGAQFVLGAAPQGSSPRVRGRRAEVAGQVCTLGLIPACAGQTDWSVKFSPSARAHPRVCGADTRTDTTVAGTLGSSPRVRGRRQKSGLVRTGPGLIPACAGQTTIATRPAPSTRAHPRVCGAD